LLGFLLIFFFKFSYRSLFLVAFFLGLFAIASFIFIKDKKAEKLEQQAKKVKLDWNIFKKNKKFVLVVATLFMLGLGALPIGLVLLKAKEIGSLGEVPLMYFVYSLTFVIVAIPIGKLADKIGEKSVIAGGFLLAAISYIGLAFTSHLFALILFFVILGVYSACTDGMQRMLAAKSLSRSQSDRGSSTESGHGELLATGQGFLNMALGFSSLGAGIIGGLLWTLVNSQAAFLYAAIASVIGLVLFLIVAKVNTKF